MIRRFMDRLRRDRTTLADLRGPALASEDYLHDLLGVAEEIRDILRDIRDGEMTLTIEQAPSADPAAIALGNQVAARMERIAQQRKQ